MSASQAEVATAPRGYRSGQYARSLAEFGRPRPLPLSGGWTLERHISDGLRDAMGCYPLYSCTDWSRLADDVAALQGALVSLVMVPDPYAGPDDTMLTPLFPDLFRPYKTHYVTDLSLDPGDVVSKHHRYYARRAGRTLTVEAVEPTSFLDAWVDLYASLKKRHRLAGIKTFSRRSFGAQLALSGTTVLVALADNGPVAAQICFEDGDVVYNHLTAANEQGYLLGATYALYWHALHHFHGRSRYFALGGSAGSAEAEDDGLSRFKRGWASGTRTAYLCGTILDREAYERLSAARDTTYFPAYRDGELV